MIVRREADETPLRHSEWIVGRSRRIMNNPG
jgi:hypothetical protein